MKKECERFFAFSVIPGKVIINRIYNWDDSYSEVKHSIGSLRCEHNFAVSIFRSPIIQTKEDLVEQAKDVISTAFETSIIIDPRRTRTAFLLFAKGKPGTRYDVDRVSYVKLLNDPWPKFQMGGLYCRENLCSGASKIFPIYYFYGKLKAVQTQVMEVFESISKKKGN